MSNVISSVKALIHNQGKYLVLKEMLFGGEVWDLPGGKIEYGESPYDSLRREIKEEVCIEVEIDRPLGVWWFFRKTDRVQVVCTTFLCRPVGDVVIDLTKNAAQEEIVEYAWMKKNDLLNLPLEYSLRDIIWELPE